MVLDASAAVELLLGTKLGEAVSGQIEPSGEVNAPHLLDAEVGQVLRRFVLRGTVDATRASQALENFALLNMTRFPHSWLLSRAWELRENCTVYDALYIALAEALGAVLITCDQRMESVPGARADVAVIGVR